MASSTLTAPALATIDMHADGCRVNTGEKRWYCFRQVHEWSPGYKTPLLPDPSDPLRWICSQQGGRRGCPGGVQDSEPEH